MNIKLSLILLVFSLNTYAQSTSGHSLLKNFYAPSQKPKFDVLLNFIGGTYLGQAGEFHGLGSGMNMDIMLVDKQAYSYGLHFMAHNNKRKQDYALDANLDQLSKTSSAKIGLIFGKWMTKYHLSISCSYAVQSVAELSADLELKDVQLRGFSSGVILNYPIIFGERRKSKKWDEIATAKEHINFHLGFRYDFLSHKQARGLLLETGIGYRVFNLSRDRLF